MRHTCKYCKTGFKNLNLHYAKSQTCKPAAYVPSAPKTLYEFLGDLKASDKINGKPAWEVIDGLTPEELAAPAADEGRHSLSTSFKVYVYLPGLSLPPNPTYIIEQS